MRTILKQTISIDKFLRKKSIKPYSKIIKQIWEKKGFNVIGIDISKGSDIADFIIICSANSNKHCQTIADELQRTAKLNKVPFSVEGYPKGDWILVDIGSIIIHIFTEEIREMYDLEGLWYGLPNYHIQEVQQSDK